MKRLLAILLTFILTFSCFSILCTGLVLAKSKITGKEGVEMSYDEVAKWGKHGYKSQQLAEYSGHVAPEDYVLIEKNTDPNFILCGDSSVKLFTNTRWYDFKLTDLKENTKYALKFSYLVNDTLKDKNLINAYGIFNYAATGARLDKQSTKNAEGYLNCVYTNGYAFVDNDGLGTTDFVNNGVRQISTKDEANVWYTATVYFNTTVVKDTLAFVIKTNYDNTFLDKFQLVEVDYTNPVQSDSAPVLSGKSKFGPFETENTTSYLYEECSASDYNGYLTTLKNKGFAEYSTNVYGNNKFAVYTKGNTTVNVTYTPNNKTILVSENATDTLPTTKAQNVYNNKGLQPLIIQLDHNNKTHGGIGMSYIVRLADGSFIIVDGGHTETKYDNANRIYNKLREYTTTGKIEIAAWLITHCHSDHISGFISFVERYSHEVNIEQVVYNAASYAQFVRNAEIKPKDTNIESVAPNYVNLDVFTATIALLKLNGTKISTCHSGYEYNIRNAVINVMFTVEDLFPSVFSVHHNDANNTSTIFKISFTDKNVDQTLLITGDCSNAECNALYAKYTGDELKSTFVQAIHHGIAYGSRELYAKMGPEVILWPAGYDRLISTLYQSQNQYFVSENSVKEVVLSDYGTRTFALPYKAPEGLKGLSKFTVPDDIENVNALEHYFGASIRKAGENGTDAKQALRFKFGVPVQILEGQTVSGYKVVEYGAMVSMSSQNLNYFKEKAAFEENNGIKTYKAVAYNKAENKNIVFDYYNFTNYDDGVHRLTNFACALNNIGVGKDGITDYSNYDTEYFIRVYIVYENANGDTKIYYGATESASIFATMQSVLKSNSNADDVAYVKNFLDGKVADFEADAEAIKTAWNADSARKKLYTPA